LIFLLSCADGAAQLRSNERSPISTLEMEQTMPLSNLQLESIAKQVYQKFPDLKGVSPQVQSQSAPGAKAVGATDRYLVVFKGKSPQNIIRVVRVTADPKGRVLKMSTSR
jgi:hypothetical protein